MMNKEMMSYMIGKVLKVDRGGAESRTGKLLEMTDDYLTLLTEDEGVIYYKTDHIKSITENAKIGFDFKQEIPDDFTYISGQNFKFLLNNLKSQWVNINRGGHEKLEGVLLNVNDDFVTLILNEEVIHLALFHIRNIGYGARVEKQNNEKDENKSKNSDDNKQKDEKK
jgi:spore coat protein B